MRIGRSVYHPVAAQNTGAPTINNKSHGDALFPDSVSLPYFFSDKRFTQS